MKKTIWLMLFCGLIILNIISVADAKSNEEIYQEKLSQLKPDDAKGHYELGSWCVQNKLVEQAKAQFEKVLELDPNHAGAHEKLGHVKYKDKWQTPEELKAQGLALYKGKWMPYDEAMKAQGYVKFEDNWMLPKERDLIIKLDKSFPWTGSIDKPGADSEGLAWEKAREKETEHFMVRTDLSVDALNDICFLMESAYFIWDDFFKLVNPNDKTAAKSKEKFKVLVPKSRQEFEKVWEDSLGSQPPPMGKGAFIPKGEPSNKSREDKLLTYYFQQEDKKTTANTLLHEGTHYAIILVQRAYLTHKPPPIWLNEGLCTYFESGRIEGKKLVNDNISQERFQYIQLAITDKTYIKLSDFINSPVSKYSYSQDSASIYYPEGWSLIYFLSKGKDGKYKPCLQKYFDAWKSLKIDLQSDSKDLWIQDKPGHVKLFEQCMGVPMDQLEQEWLDYISALKTEEPPKQE
ncbi:MAG: DUF1570 domain-containing protein [Planctomycetota bacterium]